MDWEILPQKKPQLAKPTKGFHHETHRYVQYTSLWYVEFTWNVDSCDHNTAAVITNHTQSCTNDTFCPPENHSRRYRRWPQDGLQEISILSCNAKEVSFSPKRWMTMQCIHTRTRIQLFNSPLSGTTRTMDITADTSRSSTPILRIAQLITSLRTLSKAFSKSTKPKYSFLPLTLKIFSDTYC